MPSCIAAMYFKDKNTFKNGFSDCSFDTYHLVASTDPALPFPAPRQKAHLLQTWAWGLRLSLRLGGETQRSDVVYNSAKPQAS